MPAGRTFLLLGSGEFEPWTEEAERVALARSPAPAGRVLILPTASASEGDDVFNRWANLGLAHYAATGLESRLLSLKRREDAFRPEFVTELDTARMVYFSGGRPHHLAETLEDTPFWTALLAALDRGVVYAGCSAGAMIVGEPLRHGILQRLNPWGGGLKLIPNLVFGVHWDAMPRYLPGARKLILGQVPEGDWFLGIDERTAIVGDGDAWRVFGHGGVEVLRGHLNKTYRAGETFSLSQMLQDHAL